jgi:hypothetical protein
VKHRLSIVTLYLRGREAQDAAHRDGAGIELKHNSVQDQGPRAPKLAQATPAADTAQ